MANISIDVRKKTIQELINEEIPSGKYWLPSFQRQYVWDSDNIKELLDSIIRNYPIGATILWKPSAEVASDIDPTSIPMLDGVPSNTKDRYFVIDGQQRTASLLLLFNNWSIKRGGETITCDPIAYDPVSNKFMRHRNRGIDCSKIVKAFCLHDVDILSELKSNTTGDVFNKIRLMAQKILEYPIPQYIMETTGEQETTDEENIFSSMAEAFIRINKEGIRIGNVELMLSFMAGTLSGELKARVVKLCKEFESRDITVQPIMRSVFSNLGLSQTQIAKPKQFKANIARIKGISKEDLDKRLMTSENSLRLTAEFLEKEFGIRNARLLPSQTALIPLSTYFGKSNLESIDQMPDSDRKNMTSWFLLVNLNGHYSSSVDTRLNRDIEIIRNSDGFPFVAMQEIMKVRKHIDFEYIQDGLERNVVREANKAFTFILYILLTKNKADDWGGRLITSRELSELEKHHIFPQEYLNAELELDDVEDPVEVETIVSNLANITFIHKPVNGSISDGGPIDYLPQYIEFAKLHFIPENKEFWTKEAYSNGLFQGERLKLIFEAAQKYFSDVFIDANYKKTNTFALKSVIDIKNNKERQEAAKKRQKEKEEHYNADYYISRGYDKETVRRYFNMVDEIERIVERNGWDLQKKSNRRWVSFRFGHRQVFVVCWDTKESFELSFKLKPEYKFEFEKLCPYGCEYDEEWGGEAISDAREIDTSKLEKTFEIVYSLCSKEDGDQEESDNKNYFVFYSDLVSKLKSLLPREYPSPKQRNYYQIPTNVEYAHFEWIFRKNTLGVELHFESDNKNINAEAFEKIESIKGIKEKLERALGEEVTFRKNKKWAKILIEKNGTETTEDLKDWAVNKMKIFIEILQPELNKIF